MKKLSFLLALAVLIIMAGTNTTFAQQKEKKIIEVKAVKVEKTRGADANIKAPKPTNDQIAPKSRGPVYGDNTCDVVIENHTGYTVDIYVDGYYRGTIASYVTNVTWAIPGATTLYGKSIGGTAEWGPTKVDCQWIYTWKLKD